MANWLRDGAINTDRNLRLQYLAGLGLNLYQSALIYHAMIEETRYPEHLFQGSQRTLDELKTYIERSIAGSRPTL
jgi:spermidine synthase